MTTFASPIPASLPDLTESKSSKSSSLHSSSLGAEGILGDVSHFEDIGLEEGPPISSQELYGYNAQTNAKGPLPRLTSSAGSQSRKGSPAIGPIRQLTNGSKRPSYPGPPAQVDGPIEHASHSLSLPNSSGIRNFLGSSMPSLTVTTMNLRNQSRSPSPSHNASSRPVSRGTLNGRPCSSKGSMSRRASLQPNRKSTKELEAEYNDADDDLPEDASLWNVPLSPRPAQERSSFSATNSPNPSTRTSPERPARLRGGPSKGAYLPVGPSTAPACTTSGQALSCGVGPTSPLVKPKLSHSATTGTIPEGYTRIRAKSWTIALSELSEEAKTLTELLESHAEDSERLQGDAIQNGSMVIGSDPDKLTRSKTYSVELPPLRTNNTMLDPLPISKEKEKVLSRTRPSWLPPKNRKEEKKHLKEYQRMMESSLEAERKKAASTAENKCVRDDTQTTLLRIWEEHVLPNWSQVIREPRTRELWWRGIAPRSRGDVWQRAIGNELALTEATYIKALQRAKYVEQRIGKEGSDEPRKEKTWFDAISRDAKATFPELKLFLPESPLHDDLVDVLMAYSMYRSDVGYSHSTHVSVLYCPIHFPHCQTPTTDTDHSSLPHTYCFTFPHPLQHLSPSPIS